MFHKSVLIIFAISLALTLSNRAWAEKRIALVIGNGAYPNIGELANPSNDARLMADTLRQLGFEVIEKVNVSQKPMKKAIKAFGNRLNRAGKDAIGLFYYAGHGVQVNGENYLIPVNVEIIDEADVDIEAVGMRAILQNMEYAGNDMNIIVMDACRNNPFKRGFRSASRGLARMDASKGTLIAYATAPGDVALDGKGENSPYTEALTANMLKPGVTVERMFKDVRNAVVEKTKSAQIPWESSSLTGGDFFFHPAEVIAATPSSTEATNKDFELLFWQSVLNSNSPADYEAYLSQYPNGVFASLAKVKIARLILSVENSSIEEPREAESTASLSDQSAITADGSNIDISGSYVSELTGKKDNLDATGKNQTVIIEQNGNKVKGTFGSAGDHGGEIEGTVDGNTITFVWYSSWTHGKGKWEIKPGSKSLFGTWRTSGYEGAGKWNLNRIE
jgi:hypothetical protein